jgi:hypothetical protein
MNRHERLNDLSPTRRALLGAGIATLAFSLVLSIAPAWAKNSDAGTVKLHDVTTGQDVSDTANEPHLCTFTVVFDFPADDQTGNWEIRSQAPTGDGSTVASGAYDASVNGTDKTDPITLDAGHYRLEYTPDGAHNSKNKTFWVDDCGTAGASTTPSASPSSDPSTPPSEDPTTPPSEDPTTPPSEDPSTPPSDDPSTPPSEDPSTPPSEDPSTPPSEDPSTPPSQDTTATPTPQPTEGAVEAITGSSAPSASPAAGAPASDGTTDQLPNTSVSDTVTLTSLLTALGLLMIIGAHPFIRRSAHADRA